MKRGCPPRLFCCGNEIEIAGSGVFGSYTVYSFGAVRAGSTAVTRGIARFGVAIGAKLAWPERPVLALLGEGAAAYGMQGLWTAARYNIPVVFVICNNAQYQILA